MKKTNRKLVKSAVMFMFLAIMMTFATVAAYADYDGDTEHPHDLEETAVIEINGQDIDVFSMVEDNDNGDEFDLPPFMTLAYEPDFGSLVIINSTHDGHLLSGAVFAVYPAGEDISPFEPATATSGRTEEIYLLEGVYDIVIHTPSDGYAAIDETISATVTAGELTEITIFSVSLQAPNPEPSPMPTSAPAVIETGRLLITLKAQGTGELLSGASYELRRAMDGELVTHLITDSFGEAAIDLPAGDYFLREVQAVSGFIPNPDRVNVRIAANRLNEVNLASRPEPVPTPAPVPTPEPGRLIVTVRADGTKELIQGAVFEVRRAIDNRLIAEIVSDRFGEASVSLSPDDYYLRQIASAQGFDFDNERINVRIAERAIREVSVTNRRQTPPTPPIQETPPPAPAPGRLLITAVSSATGERLEGMAYTIHDAMTDEVITTVTTNSLGEASALLPPGNYFKRNATTPDGYRQDMDRISFTIRSDNITSMGVTARVIEQPTASPTPAQTPTQTPPLPAAQSPATPSPPQSPPAQTTIPVHAQSRVTVTTRAETTGNPLHGAAFDVYRASDNRLVGEITTDASGRATMNLSPGEYYLRNASVQYGFLTERSRVFFTVASSDVAVEITIQRDKDFPYVEDGDITLPKTGEMLPVMNYMLGTLLLALSLHCGIALYMQFKRKPKRSRRKGADKYA